ncbi:DUF1254 domain-containing protein [Hyphobacterium sp.]|uniref:DUF1254 domain-containing protein n=1 Tax=Hyphobacterium sp. TaxID=2004662 RepID=UPI003BADB30F
MIRYLLAFLVAAAAVHAATVWYLPRLAMNTAMDRLASIGAATNQIAHVPPTDENSRRVVRPSPDLLYSICLLDVSNGPVRVRAADWGGYMSLAVFSGNTDNVFTRNDTEIDGDIEITIGDGGDVDLGSATGIALIRRLAPDEDTIAEADAVRRSRDLCDEV